MIDVVLEENQCFLASTNISQQEKISMQDMAGELTFEYNKAPKLIDDGFVQLKDEVYSKVKEIKGIFRDKRSSKKSQKAVKKEIDSILESIENIKADDDKKYNQMAKLIPNMVDVVQKLKVFPKNKMSDKAAKNRVHREESKRFECRSSFRRRKDR